MADTAPNVPAPRRPGVNRRYVRRGSLLSAYLVILLGLSLLAIVLHPAMFFGAPPAMSPENLLILRAATILRPFCIVAIWFWSRAGVLGFLALALISATAVSLSGLWSVLLGIVTPLILILLIRTRWQFMYWGFSRRSKQVLDEGDE